MPDSPTEAQLVAIVREIIPELDDDAAGWVLWNETGYPFWLIPELGATPEECCRRQVTEYRDSVEADRERRQGLPNPGSDEAIERSCVCPVLDNGHGRGWMGQEDVFVINERCPLHGSPEYRKAQEAGNASP